MHNANKEIILKILSNKFVSIFLEHLGCSRLILYFKTSTSMFGLKSLKMNQSILDLTKMPSAQTE